VHAAAAVIIGLLPCELHAESGLVAQTGQSGGIVVALEFPDGKSVTAKSLADGKTLWTASAGENYMKSTEIFVASGLVWTRDLTGRDPKAGKVVRTLAQEMTGPMSHGRCYRNRITHRDYLNSATGGTDFLELDGSLESPNPWARSTRGLAVMPANGMIYHGPYVCQCAIGTMASGVNAFYNGSGNADRRFTVEIEPRLVKGPAFGKGDGPAATADDWPTYRSWPLFHPSC